MRFDGTTEGGRNRPMIVSVEVAGEEVEAYVKPSHWKEMGIIGMANEVFAACIASHLGLPVCEPLLVELEDDFIEAVSCDDLRAALNRGSRLAFGSVAAGSGWRKWRDEDLVTTNMRPTAEAIFVFDALCENNDRTSGSNPNILVRSDALRVIDHEMAMRVGLLITPPRPWLTGNLQHTITPPTKHALAHRLKGQGITSAEEIRRVWTSLTDAHLDTYEAEIPREWHEAAPPIRLAKAHLIRVRDQIDDCLAEVQRVLS